MLNNLIFSDSVNRGALVIFAGWGMDSRPFESFRIDIFDTIVVYDYASDEDPYGDDLATYLQERYNGICLLAWSFGVFHAERWMLRHPFLPITYRVAVNGTSWPVDYERGIHPTVFGITLRRYSRPTISEFRRRMFGDEKSYADFMAHEPLRTDESLLGELKQISALTQAGYKAEPCIWDLVYIGMTDKIIRPESQLKAWEGHPSVIRLEGGSHYPDWNEIKEDLEHILIDKYRIASRFRLAAQTYDDNALVQATVASRLTDMLPDSISGKILEIGPGTGMLTALLRRRLAPGSSLRLWDLAPLDKGIEEVDAEVGIRTEPDCSLDMIVSSSTIQWFQSPSAFLRECRRVLRPGGVAAFSTFGKETFREISPMLANQLSYYSACEWSRIARNAGWEDVTTSESLETMKFENPVDILRHMKLTGVNGLMSGSSSVKAARLITAIYQHDAQGLYPLTYQPVYIILRK